MDMSHKSQASDLSTVDHKIYDVLLVVIALIVVLVSPLVYFQTSLWEPSSAFSLSMKELVQSLIPNALPIFGAIIATYFFVRRYNMARDRMNQNLLAKKIQGDIEALIRDFTLDQLRSEKERLRSIQSALELAVDNVGSVRRGLEDMEKQLGWRIIQGITSDIKNNSAWAELNQGQKGELSNQITESIKLVFERENSPLREVRLRLDDVYGAQGKLQEKVADVRNKQEEVVNRIVALESVALDYSKLVAQSETTRKYVERIVGKYINSRTSKEKRIESIVSEVMVMLEFGISTIEVYSREKAESEMYSQEQADST